MNSKVFYDFTIKQENIEEYTDLYLEFFVASFMYKTITSSKEEIKDAIIKEYKVNNINNSKLNLFLNRFPNSKGLYSLTGFQAVTIKMVNELKDFLDTANEVNESELLKEISGFISKDEININQGIKVLYTLSRIKKKLLTKFYCVQYYSYLRDKVICEEDIYSIILKIDKGYDDVTLNFVIKDNFLLDILMTNGINNVKDLKALSLSSLLVIFSEDIDKYILCFKDMNKALNVQRIDEFKNFYAILKPKQIEVLKMRLGFEDKPILTLQEISEKINLTRERIRQIELIALEKLKKYVVNYEIIIVQIYFSLLQKGKKYVAKSAFSHLINNPEIELFMQIAMSFPSALIKYDKELKIIYNSNQNSVDEIIQEQLNSYGDVVAIKDKVSIDEFEKTLLEQNYHEYQNGIYLKSGYTRKEMILDLVDELFPNGYHIGKEEDYNKLALKFNEVYGEDNELMSKRAVTAYFNNNYNDYSYCLVDRGTYKKREYCAKLSNELKSQIYSYILLNQPTIQYISIFEHFKLELQKIGVGNYYYLKGLLDVDLPSEFNAKRDYIQVGNTKLTSTSNILNFIHSFDGIFTFEEIKSRFEGVKDYVLYNSLYSEANNNGLIWLSSKKFVYFKNLLISQSIIDQLLAYIDDLFVSLNTLVLSVKKIYSNLSLTNKTLLKNLKVIADPFSLFSLIKEVAKNKYFCNRPLISLEDEQNLNQQIAIKKCAEKLDSFNFDLIKRYQKLLGLSPLYSYLNFMENLSDEFVQIDINTMVKKEKADFDDTFIHDFATKLEAIFTKFKVINTQTFNGYKMFPSCKYNWNKYLFVGIVRTYFTTKYIVKNTSNFYNDTDFIISIIE